MTPTHFIRPVATEEVSTSQTDLSLILTTRTLESSTGEVYILAPNIATPHHFTFAVDTVELPRPLAVAYLDSKTSTHDVYSRNGGA